MATISAAVLAPNKVTAVYKNNSNTTTCKANGTLYQDRSANGGIVRVYIRPMCKQWSCRRCGPRILKKFRKELLRIVLLHNLLYFLTLTVARRKTSRTKSLTYIRDCWDKLKTIIHRKQGKMTYFAVIERHQSGYAHLHALIDLNLNYQWLSRRWRAVGGGRKLDFAPARCLPAVVTYLTDDFTDPTVPKGQRRYSASRGIKMTAILKPKSQWYRLRDDIDTELTFAKQVNSVIKGERHSAGVLESFEEILTPIPTPVAVIP